MHRKFTSSVPADCGHRPTAADVVTLGAVPSRADWFDVPWANLAVEPGTASQKRLEEIRYRPVIVKGKVSVISQENVKTLFTTSTDLPQHFAAQSHNR